MKRLVHILSLLICFPVGVAAQPFYASPVPDLQPTMFGSVSIGDFDGDGDMDLLVTGSESGTPVPTARIYRNDGRVNGSWSFTNVGAVFPEVARYLTGPRASSTDIGDFDNDGDLDVLIGGNGGTVVYRNEGAYRFTGIRIRDEINTDRGSYFADIVTTASAAWGDYDFDGDLDVLVAGHTGTYIYRNDGFARFTQVDAGLPALPNGIVAWGDYDNDSDLDILAVSRPFRERVPVTRIFRNDGGTFVDIEAHLPGIEAGTVKWGDYDNDGDLDVLITSRLHYAVGETGRSRGPGIYRNERGTFVRTSDSLPQAWYGDWIDFDGDGDLDVLLNGLDGGGTYAQVIENVDGSFNTSSARFGGVWFGDVAIGDLDADGRVDFVMNGRYQMSSYQANRFLIYRNAGTSAQSAPPPPVGLAARRNGDLLVLSWTSPNPNIEIGPSYTYNVRVGTTPGGSEILAPMAMSSGKRLITKQGNAGHNHTITLKGMRGDLPYYWSVQTVDHRQVGSAFAPERVAYATQAPPRSAPIITENYPNPFNPSTTIRYTLPAASDVRVVVYNVLGAEVAELVNSRMESGAHEAVWSGIDAAGRPVPSGVYLYAVEAAGERIVRSMLLLK